ncbi:MAG: hypothetical protein RR232_06405 [Clostridia bacterium]
MKRIFMLLMVALMLLPLYGCAKINAYDEATALMQSGDYQAAVTMFDELEDYRDCAQLAVECRYLIAQGLMQQSDFAAASEILASLSGYKDSAALDATCNAELKNAADYESATALMQTNPKAAEAAFLALGDYRDCALMAAKCRNLIGYTVTYLDKPYTVVPTKLGIGTNGNITLTVEMSEDIIIDFGDSSAPQLHIPPVSASIYISGVEYVQSGFEFVADKICVFTFGTTESPQKVELYPFLQSSDQPSGRQQVDPATLQ